MAASVARRVIGQLTREKILTDSLTRTISASYPSAPYVFHDREYLIIPYKTSQQSILNALPPPLQLRDPRDPYPTILAEWISMPDSSGLGDYRESGVVIPCRFNNVDVNYICNMFLNNEPAIAAGREIWGYPKKYGNPKLYVDNDTLVGQCYYNHLLVSSGTLSYKFKSGNKSQIQNMLQNVPNITLKLIPSPTASFDVAQLVQVETTDVNVDEFYLGPGRIQIFEHINAPVGDFEVLQQPHDHVCMHIKTGLTLNSGHVIYDYNKQGDVAFLSGLSAMPINAPSYSPHTSYECEKDIFEIEYFTKLDNIIEYIPSELSVETTSDNECKIILRWTVSSGTSGIGHYKIVSQSVPCVYNKTNAQVLFKLQTYSNSSSLITFTREVFGERTKFAKHIDLDVRNDTIIGSINYGDLNVGVGSLVYKYSKLNEESIRNMLNVSNVSLKLIPTADCKQNQIAQLVAWKEHVIDAQQNECYQGNARLDLFHHCNCPLNDVSVQRVQKGSHFKAKTQFGNAEVLHNYLT
eukprot:82863_1